MCGTVDGECLACLWEKEQIPPMLTLTYVLPDRFVRPRLTLAQAVVKKQQQECKAEGYAVR